MDRRPRLSPRQRALLVERARAMRHAATPSEEALWARLRDGQLGVCFRRQVVVAGFIADFAAPQARLVVEVDGPWHAARERADARRDRALRRAGWRVVRIRAEEVLAELEVAVGRVREALGLGG